MKKELEKIEKLFIERDKRRRKASLQPIAYFTIALFLILATLACLAGAWKIYFALKGLRPLRVVEIEEPKATIPVEIERPGAAPTKEPTPTPIVWWQDKLRTVNELGSVYLMAPDEVVEEVKKHYVETIEFNNFDNPIFDPERLRELYPKFYTGKALEGLLASLEKKMRGEEIFWVNAHPYRAHLSVRYFSKDGMSCEVSDESEEMLALGYSYPERKVVAKAKVPRSLYVCRMVYDPEDGRWKFAEHLHQIELGGELPNPQGATLIGGEE
jgi:hypothetical protein